MNIELEVVPSEQSMFDKGCSALQTNNMVPISPHNQSVLSTTSMNRSGADFSQFCLKTKQLPGIFV